MTDFIFHLRTDWRGKCLVQEALASNWVAPLGPHVEAFEREFGLRRLDIV